MSLFLRAAVTVPQTWSLKTTEIHSLPVLEARSLKLKYWQGPAPSEASKGGSLLHVASGGPRHSFLAGQHLNLCFRSHMTFSLCVSVFTSSYKDSSHIG